MSLETSKKTLRPHLFSVAPMLDCTDRHFRVLLRQITSQSLLYTEMVVSQALHHSKSKNKFLDFDEIEHPISLQVGGNDPKLLTEAAKIAEDWGYDEINLNVGCPSSKVSAGNFGACLMAQPKLVAKCIEAMSSATNIPVTIKHRIGIDELDSDELLISFVDQVAAAGAKRFVIHARKAILKGLNPKQNRSIPPLEYSRVFHLKKQRPHLLIELNGGINNVDECLKILKTCDGAMVGRAAYQHPLRWKKIDELIFNAKPSSINASGAIKQILPYAEAHLRRNGKLWDIAKHLINLVEGVQGAKKWRYELSQEAQAKNADLKALESAAKKLENLGL